tara:strand:- start:8855 stop:9472 length:618 start_codon:yes stop_codon:yes gene_type:complete
MKIKKLIKRKKLIIFDLDGVLIDSKRNMSVAWKYATKKNFINVPFKNYFRNVGLPFYKILQNLKIKSGFEKIRRDYNFKSKKKLGLIKLYPGTKKIFNDLRANGKNLALLTSKDSSRTKKILKKFNIKFNCIECGSQKVKGKPNPTQILKILKKLKTKKKYAVYVGDSIHDSMTANNAKIDFIFASYGYTKKRKYKYNIKNLKEL